MVNDYGSEGYASSYDKVIKKFEEAYNMPRSSGRTVPETYIFDEDKSVKWNREEVKRHNQQVKENNRRCTEERYNALTEAQAGIINYLQAEYPSISIAVIEELYKYIYEKDFSYNYNITHVIDTCEEILEIFHKSATKSK